MLAQNQLNIAGRMERLPVSRFTWRIVLLTGLAWFIESLSIGSLGVILDPLKQVMHLGPGQVGMLTAASTFGIVIGLIPAGFLADRFGRKRILVWGIIIYSLLTLLCAASTSYGMLLSFRFLSGLGMGAVFPLPYAIVSEFVNHRQRTLFNGLMDACLSVGYFIAPPARHVDSTESLSKHRMARILRGICSANPLCLCHPCIPARITALAGA